MLLIAHPAHNSLAAALEILAQVQQEGGRGRTYLLRGPDDVISLKSHWGVRSPSTSSA